MTRAGCIQDEMTHCTRAELLEEISQLRQQLSDQPSRDIDIRLLARAVEAIPLGVVITDSGRPDNPIVYCNAGFEKLTGYARDEIVERNCRFLQGPKTDLAIVDDLRQAIRQKKECSVVLCNHRKDRSPFWNALSIAPIADESGDRRFFVGVQTDITRVKLLEEEYAQAQKMEILGQLAGGVAHDFNNLLTIINGYSEILQGGLPAGNPGREFVKQIQKAGERGASLTRQLLAFSHKQVVQTQPVSLNALLTESEKMLGRLLGPNVRLVLDLDAQLPLVLADPGQMEQIILNLAVNARDAMSANGTVRIQTRAVTGESNQIEVSVSDTGHGIPEEIRARIFEPFFTTKPKGKGTGLGLATVSRIIAEYRGTITVESTLGEGTSFRYVLPATSVQALAVQQAIRQSSTRGTEIILLAEDEDAIRMLLTRTLQDLGYTVLAADSGDAAIKLCESHTGSIHILISDVLMPGMSPREFLPLFQAKHPDAKLLFLSGFTDADTMPMGIQDGTIPLLAKPFSASALAAKVRETLDGPRR